LIAFVKKELILRLSMRSPSRDLDATRSTVSRASWGWSFIIIPGSHRIFFYLLNRAPSPIATKLLLGLESPQTFKLRKKRKSSRKDVRRTLVEVQKAGMDE
jgi:hypothetical protein